MSRTPEAIAAWAERQADKKPQGAAGHLSPEEKTAIILARAGTTNGTPGRAS